MRLDKVSVIFGEDRFLGYVVTATVGNDINSRDSVAEPVVPYRTSMAHELGLLARW